VSLSNPKTSLDLLVFARMSGGGPSQHSAIDVHLEVIDCNSNPKVAST
jgi:hypothetical protein